MVPLNSTFPSLVILAVNLCPLYELVKISPAKTEPAPAPAPSPAPSPSPPSGSLTPQEYAYLTSMMDFFLDYMSTSELLHICLVMYNQPYLLPSFYSDLAQNGVNSHAISYSSALIIAEASFIVSCESVGIYLS